MTYTTSTLKLVADIGGTNTRIALAQGTELLLDTIARFRNDDYELFDDVLLSYIVDHANPAVESICIDVAGPVSGETAALTNRNWRFSCTQLRTLANCHNALILNDMQAQGFALNLLPPDQVETVWAGETPGVSSTKLVVNVGTGFNIAPVYC